jgi:hypothetical protein
MTKVAYRNGQNKKKHLAIVESYAQMLYDTIVGITFTIKDRAPVLDNYDPAV